MLALVAVAVVAPASAAGGSNSSTPSTARAHPRPWKGTITFVAEIDHTLNGKDPYGVPQTLTETYQERAVFKLSGGKPTGVNFRATVTGSGTGTAVYSGGQSGTCTLNNEPMNEWSYTGPTVVAVWTRAGRLFVLPRAVTKTVHTVFTGCANSKTLSTTRAAPNPFYLGVASVPFGVKVSSKARSASGSKQFPIRIVALGVTEVAGTATLSWHLTR